MEKVTIDLESSEDITLNEIKKKILQALLPSGNRYQTENIYEIVNINGQTLFRILDVALRNYKDYNEINHALWNIAEFLGELSNKIGRNEFTKSSKDLNELTEGLCKP